MDPDESQTEQEADQTTAETEEEQTGGTEETTQQEETSEETTTQPAAEETQEEHAPLPVIPFAGMTQEEREALTERFASGDFGGALADAIETGVARALAARDASSEAFEVNIDRKLSKYPGLLATHGAAIKREARALSAEDRASENAPLIAALRVVGKEAIGKHKGDPIAAMKEIIRTAEGRSAAPAAPRTVDPATRVPTGGSGARTTQRPEQKRGDMVERLFPGVKEMSGGNR